MILFVTVFTAIFLSLIFVTRFFRKRQSARPKQDSPWGDLALGLFENGKESFPGDRVEQTLKAALRSLGLSHGIITVSSGDSCRILRLVSEGYGRPKGLVEGQVLPRSRIFCGELRKGREILAIDFASLSDWRRHAAYRELGWESYIGVRHEMESGESFTLGFFHSLARDQLFSATDKEFARQVALWISCLLGREHKELAGAAVLSEMKPPEITAPGA